ISLTGLTEILYQARDEVCREPAAFSQGVMVNGGSEGVSAGGTVTSIRTTEPTLETSYTPAMTAPDAADITTSTESLTLSSYAGSSIPLKGEQWSQLANTVGAEMALQQLYKQAIRKMVNSIEAAIATAAYKGASRAVGTAGTTPFASNFNTVNELRQILEDNGTPMDDGM
ncbi:P22 phage major capsid protein family protein, partial [Mesomycoplasma ovipneumoniae]|uniref:P22 phage major capsid protein family protein n=1 Tax=Mesomycoplasma ovipneumoniae TaxID=29562 RepID=UPI00307FE6CF